MELKFDTDGFGNQVLFGLTYENVQFSDLEISPPEGTKVRIESCKFLNCSTSPGTCFISGDVTLDNVVISEFDCGDAIKISAEAELRTVVIKGRRPSSLIIQPNHRDCFAMPEPKQIEFQLDISEYWGDVMIIGMRGRMVRKDLNRHVTVQTEWKDEVDWKELGISPFSYWSIFIKKLTLYNTKEGVFSLPDRSDKHYDETMREREIIEKAGVKFV